MVLSHPHIPAPEEVFDSSFLSQTLCLGFVVLLLLSQHGGPHWILRTLWEKSQKDG